MKGVGHRRVTSQGLIQTGQKVGQLRNGGERDLILALESRPHFIRGSPENRHGLLEADTSHAQQCCRCLRPSNKKRGAVHLKFLHNPDSKHALAQAPSFGSPPPTPPFSLLPCLCPVPVSPRVGHFEAFQLQPLFQFFLSKLHVRLLVPDDWSQCENRQGTETEVHQSRQICHLFRVL